MRRLLPLAVRFLIRTQWERALRCQAANGLIWCTVGLVPHFFFLSCGTELNQIEPRFVFSRGNIIAAWHASQTHGLYFARPSWKDFTVNVWKARSEGEWTNLLSHSKQFFFFLKKRKVSASAPPVWLKLLHKPDRRREKPLVLFFALLIRKRSFQFC